MKKIILILLVIILVIGTAFTFSVPQLTEPEAAILHLINNTRVSHGLNALNYNQRLTEIARFRSQDMISREYYSHYTPEDKNITHILLENNISYRNFGEMLGRAIPAKCGTPEIFIKAWMSSYSHRNAMLKYYYTDIGVGIVDSGNCRIITVIFIRR